MTTESPGAPPLLELLRFLAASVVSRPDSIRISRVETPNTDLFYLSVASDDLGRLLGREGKTVEAIRTVLDVAAAQYGKSTIVDVVEPRRKSGDRRTRVRRRESGARRSQGSARKPKPKSR